MRKSYFAISLGWLLAVLLLWAFFGAPNLLSSEQFFGGNMLAIALISVPTEYAPTRSNYFGWALILVAIGLVLVVWPIGGLFQWGVIPVTMILALSGFWIADLEGNIEFRLFAEKSGSRGAHNK